MKCFYRIDGGVWIKGEMRTMQGVDVLIHPTESIPDPALTMMFRDPEILFNTTGIMITGYRNIDENNTYKLVSVDVSPGWTQPK